MKTTLDIPDELLAQLKARAARDGREIDQLAASQLADALAGAGQDVAGLGPKTLPVIGARPAAALPEPIIATDPETGLPVIYSPPDAPIHRMTAAEFQAVIDAANEEEDLVRAGPLPSVGWTPTSPR